MEQKKNPGKMLARKNVTINQCHFKVISGRFFGRTFSFDSCYWGKENNRLFLFPPVQIHISNECRRRICDRYVYVRKRVSSVIVNILETDDKPLTSQINRKSCCSTRNNSQVVFVTTVLSRGRSCKIDSPNVAPMPKLHNVAGLCYRNGKKYKIKRTSC